MTYDEESYIFDSLTEITLEVSENNRMLKDICRVVNTYLANHHQENEDDFGRNVLANLLSGMLDLKGFKARR